MHPSIRRDSLIKQKWRKSLTPYLSRTGCPWTFKSWRANCGLFLFFFIVPRLKVTCFIFIFTSFLCNGRVMLLIPRRVNKTWVIWLMAGGFFSYLELWIVDENSFVFSASLSSRLRVVTGIIPQGYCYLYLFCVCILYNCQIKTVALIVLVFPPLCCLSLLHPFCCDENS